MSFLEELFGSWQTPRKAAFHQAARHGDLEAVKKLLEQKPGLVFSKDKSHDGYTALHCAVHDNRVDLAELLLARRAEVNAKDQDGRTPLDRMYYSPSSAKNMIKLFHQHGGLFSEIAQAARYNDIASVKTLLKGNPDLVVKKGLLHDAAKEDSNEVAELLLASNADVNAKDNEKYTPLHHAAAKGHEGMVKLLLAYKADVNIKHEYMSYANGSASLLEWGGSDDGNTALHYAAFYGHREVAELLLASGVDVNAKENDEGHTPLHWAAMKDRKEMVELLLAKKADANAKTWREGSTPLHYAALFGKRAAAEILLANYAEVNAKNGRGETPVKLAEFGEGFGGTRRSPECKEVAELLRQHGGQYST
jgi:ankyrin repeat protein